MYMYVKFVLTAHTRSYPVIYILYCIVYIYFVLFRYILTSTLMIVSATNGAIYMVHSVFNIKFNCSLVKNDE